MPGFLMPASQGAEMDGVVLTRDEFIDLIERIRIGNVV